MLYDDVMGFTTTLARDPEPATWAVVVKADLSRAESNDLFLSGDSMVSWPVDGLESTEDCGPQRSSMFVSEVAARPHGLKIRYREQAQAERAAAVLRVQFNQIGIEEETQLDGSKDSNRTDPLRDALADYMTIPGMKAALLVSDQGLVISGIAHDGVDTASIAALAIDSVQTVQRFGLLVQAGFLNALRIEFDKLTVVLAPFAPDVMLALVAVAGSLGALSGDLTPDREAATAVALPVSGAKEAGGC